MERKNIRYKTKDGQNRSLNQPYTFLRGHDSLDLMCESGKHLIKNELSRKLSEDATMLLPIDKFTPLRKYSCVGRNLPIMSL